VQTFSPGQSAFFQGSSCKDMRLRVLVERQLVVEKKLEKDVDTLVEVKVAKGQRVLLLFSDYLQESSGRQVAFKVSSTNLFTEVDAFR